MLRAHLPAPFFRFVTSLILPLLAATAAPLLAERALFEDGFEGDLAGWRLIGAQAIHLLDSGDAEHGKVLELVPDGAVYALIRGSGDWGAVRVDCDVLFPDDDNNYLGLIYDFTEEGGRTDFGSIYLKGNGSYLHPNPWRDGNASRLLYEEYRTDIRGEDAVEIGRWHHFRAEVDGHDVHVYVGDMTVPKLTFDLYEGDSGMLGFKPRIAGYPVWIDNVRVTSIESLTYAGPRLPAIDYAPDELITDWEVLGPLTKPSPLVERAGTPRGGSPLLGEPWRPFEVDARGAVVTGRVTEYNGARTVAYFRTTVDVAEPTTTTLHLTTADELGLFVNGRFWGFVYRDGYLAKDNDWNVWHDFWRNREHAGWQLPIALAAGANSIVLRVRGGPFAAGGFFARLEPIEP